MPFLCPCAAGLWPEALDVLAPHAEAPSQGTAPMVHYLRALCLHRLGQVTAACWAEHAPKKRVSVAAAAACVTLRGVPSWGSVRCEADEQRRPRLPLPPLQAAEAQEALAAGAAAPGDYVFPSRLLELRLLEWVAEQAPQDARCLA